MFAGGLANVQKQTKAQKGDKTMMDALIPAVEAIQACPSDDIKEILEAGAKAALAGAASTVPVTTANVPSVMPTAVLPLGVACLNRSHKRFEKLRIKN